MTTTLTPPTFGVLPVLPAYRGHQISIAQYALRSGIEDYQLNPHGAYGRPIVHAVADNQHIVYTDACPRLSRAEVERLFANEQILRPAGLMMVEFCSQCVCYLA